MKLYSYLSRGTTWRSASWIYRMDLGTFYFVESLITCWTGPFRPVHPEQMKDQQEIRSGKLEIFPWPGEVPNWSVLEFRGQIKKGVESGRGRKKQWRGERERMRNRRKTVVEQKGWTEKRERRGKRRKGGEQGSEKGKTKGRRCWTFAISPLVLSYSREGSFHFSPFYGEWNL